jgi:hypothetical protein
MKNLSRNIMFLLLCLLVSNMNNVFSVNVTFKPDKTTVGEIPGFTMERGNVMQEFPLKVSAVDDQDQQIDTTLTADKSTTVQMKPGTFIYFTNASGISAFPNVKFTTSYIIPKVDTTFTISNCLIDKNAYASCRISSIPQIPGSDMTGTNPGA